MRRTKAEAEQTRQQLLKVALKLFDEKGYQGTTLSEIASEAGVTRGALYWHFENKIDILTALIDSYFIPFNESLMAIDTTNIWDNLTTFYIQTFTDIGANPEHIRFIRLLNTQRLQLTLESPFTNLIVQRKASVHNHVQHLIRQAIENGELPSNTDPHFAFFRIETTFCGIMCILAHNNLPIHVADYTQKLITQTFESIRLAN